MKTETFVKFIPEISITDMPVAIATKEVKSLSKAEVVKYLAQPNNIFFPDLMVAINERRCSVCGCTEMDCSQCIERTGHPCSWAGEELCSACL